MMSLGILDAVGNARRRGLSLEELAEQTKLSEYSVSVLVDMAVSIGVLKRDEEGRFRMGKVGAYLRHDRLTKVNINFTQDVCYQGLFHLEEAVATETPAGLKVLGDWPSIYEGRSAMPDKVRKS